jgi:dTMP kinase
VAGRGRFITLEGGEGTGKTTQAALLETWLRGQGHQVRRTREPGGTPNGEAVRALFVTGAADRWDPLSELYLLNAARRDHVLRVIEPALAAGTWVVCDRYVDSTRVYQGRVKGLSDALICQHHREATDDLWPDLTFVFDIDPEIGLARAKGRAGDETRFESETLDFHAGLRAGFAAIAAADAQRCRMIDASQPVDAVHAAVIAALS